MYSCERNSLVFAANSSSLSFSIFGSRAFILSIVGWIAFKSFWLGSPSIFPSNCIVVCSPDDWLWRCFLSIIITFRSQQKFWFIIPYVGIIMRVVDRSDLNAFLHLGTVNRGYNGCMNYF